MPDGLSLCSVESRAFGHRLRLALLLAAGIGLSACGVRVQPVDILSSLCRAGRPAVGVAPRVEHVFQKLLAAAGSDLRGTDVRLTVVSELTEGARPAWSCGTRGRADIVLRRETIEDPRVGAAALAHIIGHEIAHVVLHHPPRSAPASFEKTEAEADELSVAYLVRAGYDCTQLQEFLDRQPLRRDHVRTVCERLRAPSRANPS